MPELRRREVLENERYVALTRRICVTGCPGRSGVPADGALRADRRDASVGARRLRPQRRDGGRVRRAQGRHGVDPPDPGRGTGCRQPPLFAVLPDTAAARHALSTLRDEARDLL
ncbi:hypothetical protein ACR6C2_20540 [Streptomyces sp. INA 01156]